MKGKKKTKTQHDDSKVSEKEDEEEHNRNRNFVADDGEGWTIIFPLEELWSLSPPLNPPPLRVCNFLSSFLPSFYRRVSVDALGGGGQEALTLTDSGFFFFAF